MDGQGRGGLHSAGQLPLVVVRHVQDEKAVHGSNGAEFAVKVTLIMTTGRSWTHSERLGLCEPCFARPVHA